MDIITILKPRSIKVNELNTHDHNSVITGVTYNNKLYIELELYFRLNKLSDSTISRIKKSIPNRNDYQCFINMNKCNKG